MKLSFTLLVTIVLFFETSCNTTSKSSNLQGREYDGSIFGKQFKIEVVGDSANYQNEIDRVLIQVQKQFNLLDSNSTLFKINFSKIVNEPIEIDDPDRIFVRFFHPLFSVQRQMLLRLHVKGEYGLRLDLIE